jgi:adenosine deaminase
MEDHNLKRLLDLGLCVTVNSDDPAYFGGYMNENYLAVQKALGLDLEDIRTLARNAIQATFLGQEKKQMLSEELDAYFD